MKTQFIPIKDQEIRARLIREAAKLNSSATIRIKNQSIHLQAALSDFDLSKGTFRASLEQPLSLNPANSQFLFRVEVSNIQIFFQTEMCGFEPISGAAEFRIPKEIYKTQQRRNPRITVSTDQKVHVFHADPIHSDRSIKRKVLDMSASGLALQLFLGEERNYYVGQKLGQFQLQVGGDTFTCWASVRNIRVNHEAASKPGKITMGVELNGLSESRQVLLQSCVESVGQHKLPSRHPRSLSG